MRQNIVGTLATAVVILIAVPLIVIWVIVWGIADLLDRRRCD